METYTDTDDPEEKAQTLNLITHVDVQRAHESDANALIPVIVNGNEKCTRSGKIKMYHPGAH
ncbi:hypothetical protein [uncultured Desulfosarcina sp.]|uniref:hypothetical protein n=1 Tax=uncultured Desulfosarcina sp. TaxID=218289 RepID=UPI0029C95805|nr:hypothetical protein [uncultured Desulfosarcina sp.]